MFCINCGSKVDDNAQFCSNCGQLCNQETSQNSNFNEQFQQSTAKVKETLKQNGIIKFVLNAIRSPFTTMKSQESLPTNSLALTTAITLLLVPIVNICAIKLFAYNIFSKLYKTMNALDGKMTDPRELSYMKESLNQMLSMYMPTGKMITANLIFQVSFFGIIALVIYLFANNSAKNTFSKQNFVKTFAVTTSVNLAFTILAAILLSMSVTLSILINLVGAITIVCLLFNGLKNMFSNENTYLYIYTGTTALAFVTANFIFAKYLISTLTVFLGNLF